MKGMDRGTDMEEGGNVNRHGRGESECDKRERGSWSGERSSYPDCCYCHTVVTYKLPQ